MANDYVDDCIFLPASGGTADFVYLSSVNGYQSPSAAGASDGKVYEYRAQSTDLTQWENGSGVYTAASGTIARTTVTASSNAGAKVNFSSPPQVALMIGAASIKTFPRNDQAQSFAASQQAQVRANILGAPIQAMAAINLNVNSGMELSLANETNAVTLTATASLVSTHILDGAVAGVRGTFVAAAQQVTDAPVGYRNSIKFTVSTAEASLGISDELSIYFPIEGYRCSSLAFGSASANALAIWFWVKAHRTGAYSGSVRNGAKARSYPFNFTINNADTWEFKSVLISTGDTTGTWATDNTAGLYLNIAIAAGSGRCGTANAWATADYSGVTGTTNGIAALTDVFQITGIGSLPLVAGVTVGDLPTSATAAFLVRLLPVELRECERLYEKSYARGAVPGAATHNNLVLGGGVGNGTQTSGGTIRFRCEKRAAPTMSYWDGAGNASKTSARIGGVWTDNQVGLTSIAADINGWLYDGGFTAAVFPMFHFVADARLA